MQITLKPSTSRRRAQHTLQARFDKLRQQLARQENRNRKLASELDALVDRYQSQMREADGRHLDPLIRLAERLIVFFSRKSLANWQREELGDWINETLQRISRVDSETAERLHGDFRRTVAAYLELSEAEMDAQAKAFAESVEAAIEEMFTAGKADGDDVWQTDDPQPDLFEGLGFEFFDDEEEQSGDPGNTDTKAQTQRLVDGSWTRSLFRRAAQALHPDREPDPSQRQRKEELMQQLLAAREQGDILTLLQLFGEGTDTDELALAETEMAQACELMETRLEEQREAQDKIIHDHPLRLLVYELFYSPTRKTREQRFTAWQGELHTEAAAMARLPGELRNLSVLKVFLEQRREQRLVSQLDDMIFDI